MLDRKVYHDEAVSLIAQHLQRVDPQYTSVDAERDYVRRPDIALGYIRNEMLAQEEEAVSACSVVSKGKKIA